MSQRHMCVLHTMHVKISSASLHDSFVLFHHNNIACVRRSARRKAAQEASKSLSWWDGLCLFVWFWNQERNEGKRVVNT